MGSRVCRYLLILAPNIAQQFGFNRFSGDTVPSDNLIQAGKGVSVLIHEASLSDEEEELAVAKQHSTVGQAIDVGRQ
jgi:ribonuclease BN (tRNA processing enzyme)